MEEDTFCEGIQRESTNRRKNNIVDYCLKRVGAALGC